MLPVLTSSVLAVVLFLGIPAAGTNEVGQAFLEENKNREGVIVRKSGLQYKVLRKGTGKFSPKVGTPCDCHYVGTTLGLTPNAIDLPEDQWSEFDSSYKRGEPTSFAPNQVIKGWTEAMQLMVEGDKWEMYIPSELGYGDRGTGSQIKGGDMLIFRMELISIKGDKKRTVTCNVKTKEDCDEDELKMLGQWADKPLSEVSDKISSLKTQLKGTLKTQERASAEALLKLLKKLKAKKDKEEL